MLREKDSFCLFGLHLCASEGGKEYSPGCKPGELKNPEPTSSEGAAQMYSIPQIFWIIIDAMFV
jgi:hypothetical protein